MELTDIKSICEFIEGREYSKEIAYYVEIYQKVLEALQNILAAKKAGESAIRIYIKSLNSASVRV